MTTQTTPTTQSLIERLFQSDAASALTNEAARKIERMAYELQVAINERNQAWFQLEEAGIEIQPVSNGE